MESEARRPALVNMSDCNWRAIAQVGSRLAVASMANRRRGCFPANVATALLLLRKAWISLLLALRAGGFAIVIRG